MDYEDQLPCGGFQDEDKIIKNKLESISLDKETDQKNCCKKECSQQCKKQCVQEKQIIQQVVKIKGKNCKKCSINQAVLLHKGQAMCKACLLKNIQYKCRLNLQNKIRIKKNDSALLCFSGGLNSICLINIMSSLQKRYQKNPLFDKIKCIHILQQSTLPENFIQNFNEQTGLSLQIIRIQEIFSNQPQLKNYQTVRQLISMFKGSANSADLLEIFRDKLIKQYAKKNKFTHIMKGNNTENLATQIFKSMVKGKGGNITDMTIYNGINFAYPLREHIQKELQYYFYTERLSRLSLKAQEDDLSNLVTNSLDTYLEKFIVNLQDMYSHTAPAITRTGEKLISNKLNETVCQWCCEIGVFQQNQRKSKLCLRCLRTRQSLKPGFNVQIMPDWMKSGLGQQK